MQTITFKWISSEGLLYSTGNYIQSPGIDHDGKEYKKKNVYMFDWVTLLYSRNWHNTVNQLYFNKNKKISAIINWLLFILFKNLYCKSNTHCIQKFK